MMPSPCRDLISHQQPTISELWPCDIPNREIPAHHLIILLIHSGNFIMKTISNMMRWALSWCLPLETMNEWMDMVPSETNAANKPVSSPPRNQSPMNYQPQTIPLPRASSDTLRYEMDLADIEMFSIGGSPSTGSPSYLSSPRSADMESQEVVSTDVLIAGVIERLEALQTIRRTQSANCLQDAQTRASGVSTRRNSL